MGWTAVSASYNAAFESRSAVYLIRCAGRTDYQQTNFSSKKRNNYLSSTLMVTFTEKVLQCNDAHFQTLV